MLKYGGSDIYKVSFYMCKGVKESGRKSEYVLLINYNNNSIIPHEFNKITKYQIIEAGIKGELLPPKSSKHIFYDLDGIKRPLISLSVIIG